VTDQFLAEIRIFPFNFAPQGWAFCDGQLLDLDQNTALFSLLGTYYGGDGKSNFALPNLQGCAPIHTGGDGPGPGTSQYYLGQSGGSDSVTLLASEIPVHNHTLKASNQPGEDATPGGEVLARSVGASLYQTTTGANLVLMSMQSLSIAGNSFPHNNMMPYLTLNFCIALQGIFPPRP